jgi:U5 small nuclear ribonucleoprotein component
MVKSHLEILLLKHTVDSHWFLVFSFISFNRPSPAAAAMGKVARCYSGSMESKPALAMKRCDPNGPLMIHCVKLYSSNDGQSFETFGRIYSGTIHPGDRVQVLGEGYSPQDQEDMAIATVEAVSIPRGRSRTDVTAASAGNWVLLKGVDSNIAKTATIVGLKSNMDEGQDEEDEEDGVQIFSPLKFAQAGGESVMKLAIEPLNPAELPKMVEGLRRVSKAYPMVKTRVEESGEHVLFGTGELYMDCVMHDLRHVYSDVEVKVADPVVSFRETVVDSSSLKCFAEVRNNLWQGNNLSLL